MYSMGGLAEYCVVPANGLTILPESLPYIESAVLGCAVFTAYGTMANAAQVKPGDSVAVIGIGGVGSRYCKILYSLRIFFLFIRLILRRYILSFLFFPSNFGLDIISSIHGRHSTLALVVFLFNLNVPFTSVHEIIVNMLQLYHL